MYIHTYLPTCECVPATCVHVVSHADYVYHPLLHAYTPIYEGNAMGYIRMIRSGGMNCVSGAIRCVGGGRGEGSGGVCERVMMRDEEE